MDMAFYDGSLYAFAHRIAGSGHVQGRSDAQSAPFRRLWRLKLPTYSRVLLPDVGLKLVEINENSLNIRDLPTGSSLREIVDIFDQEVEKVVSSRIKVFPFHSFLPVDINNSASAKKALLG